jgi:hypothetical protein
MSRTTDEVIKKMNEETIVVKKNVLEIRIMLLKELEEREQQKVAEAIKQGNKTMHDFHLMMKNEYDGRRRELERIIKENGGRE